MKLGACPCCESRNLKRLKGESFVCLDCNAPLRFTWNVMHGVGLFVPVMLSNLLQPFTYIIRYGIPVLLYVVLLLLYFRYRRFYLDDAGITSAVTMVNDELRQIDRFLACQLGALDLINQIDTLKTAYQQSPDLQPFVQAHFNRVGGLSVEEQAQGFATAYPEVDFNSVVLAQQQAALSRLAQLKKYQIPAAPTAHKHSV